MRMNIHTALASVLALTVATAAQADSVKSCEDYPYGASVTEVAAVEGGLKIMATASAPVEFDDKSAIRDAREEAELAARGIIGDFINNKMKNEREMERVVNESREMQGDTKQSARQELVTRMTKLASSSDALLKGVVPLGGCYTKNDEYRVTVGIKPETVAYAEQLSATMGIDAAKTYEAKAAAPAEEVAGAAQAPEGEKTGGTKSFSHDKSLDKF